jgi:hypothetical protein
MTLEFLGPDKVVLKNTCLKLARSADEVVAKAAAKPPEPV